MNVILATIISATIPVIVVNTNTTYKVVKPIQVRRIPTLPNAEIRRIRRESMARTNIVTVVKEAK